MSDTGLSDQALGAASLQPSVDDGPEPEQWRVTNQQKAAALDAFLAGGSIGEAARAAGMAWSTTRLLLDSEIESSGRDLITWHQLTDDELTEAAKLRAEGWSYAALGQHYGVTRQAITARLKAQAADS